MYHQPIEASRLGEFASQGDREAAKREIIQSQRFTVVLLERIPGPNPQVASVLAARIRLLV
jgi:hypothetical protein